jgi:hypothetical protein
MLKSEKYLSKSVLNDLSIDFSDAKNGSGAIVCDSCVSAGTLSTVPMEVGCQ